MVSVILCNLIPVKLKTMTPFCTFSKCSFKMFNTEYFKNITKYLQDTKYFPTLMTNSRIMGKKLWSI